MNLVQRVKSTLVWGSLLPVLLSCGSGLNVGVIPLAATFSVGPSAVVVPQEIVPIQFSLPADIVPRIRQLEYRVTSSDRRVLSSGALETSARSFDWVCPQTSSTKTARVEIRVTLPDGTIARARSKVFQIATQVRRVQGFKNGLDEAGGTAAELRMPYAEAITSDGTYLYHGWRNVIYRTRLSDGFTDFLFGRPGVVGGFNVFASNSVPVSVRDMVVLGDFLYFNDDQASVVRRVGINPSLPSFRQGEIFAGALWTTGTANGVGSAARFRFPISIATDGTSLFVTDGGNHTIRSIDPTTANVTTLAGAAGTEGYANGSGAVARFNSPRSLVFVSGSLYVNDSNMKVRSVNPTTGATADYFGTFIAGSTEGNSSTGTVALEKLAAGTNQIFLLDYWGHTIRQISVPGAVSSLRAGSYRQNGALNGIGSAARLSEPVDGVVVGSYLYFLERSTGSIRRLDLTTDEVTTFAGPLADPEIDIALGLSVASSATLGSGLQATTDDGNTYYFTEQIGHVVRRLDLASQTVTTVAGAPGQSGNATGPAASARFSLPWGIAKIGNRLYIADHWRNHIKEINLTTEMVSVAAGDPAGAGGSANGTGTAARFGAPTGLATDGTTLFIADRDSGCIRRMDSSYVVSTLAGLCGTPGTLDGTGTAARIQSPVALTISVDGSRLYFGTNASLGGHTIREVVISTGAVTTIAGQSGVYGSVDAVGTAARFGFIYSLHATANHLFIADTNSAQTLRTLRFGDRLVETVSGQSGWGTIGANADGLLRSTSSQAFGLGGNSTTVFLLGNEDTAARLIDVTTTPWTTQSPAGVPSHHLTKVPGSKDGSTRKEQVTFSFSQATDGKYIYGTDRVNHVLYRTDLDGTNRTTLAGEFGRAGVNDGVGTSARIAAPEHVAIHSGSLYFSEVGSPTVRRLNLDNFQVTTVAGVAGSFGTTNGPGTSARFQGPQGLCVADNRLFIVDSTAHQIRSMSLAGQDFGTVTLLAGAGGSCGYLDGNAATAQFCSPRDCVAQNGYVYVSEPYTNTIRRVNASTGAVDTFAGADQSPQNQAGVGTSARLTWPNLLASDGEYLYISTDGGVIWKANFSTGRVTAFLGTADVLRDSSDGLTTQYTHARTTGLLVVPGVGLMIGNRAFLKLVE